MIFTRLADFPNSLRFQLVCLPVLLLVLTTLGCATNHIHPDFERHLNESETITGLLVRLEATGLEMGGLKHQGVPPDDSVMWLAIRAMQKLFTEQQLQRMTGLPSLRLPEELTSIGYGKEEIECDTKLLSGLLKSAIRNPRISAKGNELEAVRRLATRSGSNIVLLGDIHTTRHMSEKSRSFGQFLAILAAAAGQYYVSAPQNTAVSHWVILDPSDGSILRALEDRLQF